jgi:hypothetical protein
MRIKWMMSVDLDRQATQQSHYTDAKASQWHVLRKENDLIGRCIERFPPHSMDSNFNQAILCV